MRLLGFSDLHRNLDGARDVVRMAAEVDVVLAAGDFAVVHRGLEETIGVLEEIETPTLLVPGNNETENALREACADWPAATVLHGEGTEIGGVPFFGLGGGIPTTPWDWSFDLTDEQAETMLAGCPDGGVLVLHSPPNGYVDGTDGRHFGSPAILRAIEARRPVLAVCGHIHECWGQEAAIGSTRIVNLGPHGTFLEI